MIASPHTVATPPALCIPPEWEPAPARDVALDLLRGLAMVILVVNHTRLESALGHVTSGVLSAAEVLVGVSGIVVGMVFGRRWVTHGARATTRMLLRRSGKLYIASVIVVALVGAAQLVPGLATEALTVARSSTGPIELYAFDGPLRMGVAILTLEAGPWQFCILGFFIVSLTIAPFLLGALARGAWPVMLIGSWALFALGRGWQIDALPSQSERPFPILVWQILFVNGMVVGWYREQIATWARKHARPIRATLAGLVALLVIARLAGPALMDATAWAAWEVEHFDKRSLDLARLVALTAVTASLYLGLRRYGGVAERLLGPLLLPLGRCSFYVFIVHVFLCLAVASIPVVATGDGLGPIGNSLVQIAVVALLWTMVSRRFLFRWIPR